MSDSKGAAADRGSSKHDESEEAAAKRRASMAAAAAIDFVDMEEHLTREAHFGDRAREFMMKHVEKFAGKPYTETHDLELYDAYKEYKAIYESVIVGYLTSHGCDELSFTAMCKEALRGPSEDDGGHREFIEILLSAMEYERFFMLMRSAARKMGLEGEDDE